jgi:hypothetical protein
MQLFNVRLVDVSPCKITTFSFSIAAHNACHPGIRRAWIRTRLQ